MTEPLFVAGAVCFVLLTVLLLWSNYRAQNRRDCSGIENKAAKPDRPLVRTRSDGTMFVDARDAYLRLRDSGRLDALKKVKVK